MKVVVAVASRHGATRELAQVVAASLNSELTRLGVDAEVELAAAGEVESLADVDAVVLGSAVYFGHWLSAAQHFVERHRETLAMRPLWLFSSGPLDSNGTTDIVGPGDSLGARDHHLFGGRLHVDDLSWTERVVVGALRASDTDEREMADVAEWARSIATALAQELSHPDNPHTTSRSGGAIIEGAPA